MAKTPILSNIVNISTSAPTINSNNNLIESAFRNTISRDGSTPNQMEADLDLNSHDLLNAGTVEAENLIVDGVDLQSHINLSQFWATESKRFRDEAENIVESTLELEAKRSVDTFTGTGVQTVFTLSEAPVSEDFTQVYVDGVYQNKSTYSISGLDIIFSEAPPLDSTIEVNTLEQGSVGTLSSQYVSYGESNVKDTLDSLVESPKYSQNFSSREELALALPTLTEGKPVSVGGVDYVVDSTATGMDSAMWDIGVNGVRSLDRPVNAWVSAFHNTNSPRELKLYSSADGVSYRRLNDMPLLSAGAPMIGGNPVLKFWDGYFYLLSEGYSYGSFDFIIYRSQDLTTWERFNCKAGPSAVASATVPAPGATVPASEVWGADMEFSPDGTLDVWITLPFGPAVTDAFGVNMAADRRVYRTRCTDLATLTFSPPQLVTESVGHPARVYQSTTGALVAPTRPLAHLTTRASGDAGFDVAFAEFFTSAFPKDDLIFVPCGKGGSGFSNGEWTAGGASYTATVSRMQAVIAANPGAVVEGVLWNQGGADTNNTNYQTQLSSLIDRLRADIPQLAGKPFIMGHRAPSAPGGSVDVNSVMNTVAAAKTNVAVVTADGLVSENDLLHFSSESYRALGMRYWKAFKSLRGSVGSGTTPVKRIVLIAGQSNAVGWNPYRQPSLIDASATRTPTGGVLALKDEILKVLRFYDGPGPTGPWTFREVVYDDTYKLEGPSLVPRRNADGSVDWDLYAEGHNDVNGVRSNRMMVWRGNGGAGGWTSRQLINSSGGIRHGSPLNLAFADPAAFKAYGKYALTVVGSTIPRTELEVELQAGQRTIYPQQDTIYFVTGVGNVVNLTLLDGPADGFWLAVMSASSTTGIIVKNAEASLTEAVLGFGNSNDRMIRFQKRGATGKYYPTVGGTRAAFSANKGGTTQSVTAGTSTQITFGTKDFDIGGHFSGSVWTPPPGRYLLSAQALVLSGEAGATNSLFLRKNGSMIRQAQAQWAGVGSIGISAIVTANGTDTFELAINMGGTGSKTITGAATNTWFEGAPV